MVFTLPGEDYTRKWQLIIDTSDSDAPMLAYEAKFSITAQPRSLIVLMSDDD